MRNFPYFVVFVALYVGTFSYGQKKTLNAIPAGNITIDGKLTDAIWEFAPIATSFIMFTPDNGKPITENKKTEVQVAYNDGAIYIAAKMYDENPNQILKEITQRDFFGTVDNFAVFINGFNDSQQDFRFFVTAAGVQLDCISTINEGEDYTWDAIWESKALITDFGWVVEMRIPYAALRFPKDAQQTWGLNFYREIKKDRQTFTWNFIDSKINNENAQSGILTGIDHIDPPTRLFLFPYSSFYLNANKYEKTSGELKGGLDIKYGITDAFTLDAILVPDFGQTKFDNVELNLSPFEQQFSENRPFFTEGTDLFNKGDLVYSRRIGESPGIATNANEIIEEYPNSIKLVNAVKVSGRTRNGLGIGVLNAVTEKTSITITDELANSKRRAVLSPVTNFSVVVLDQRFRKNSSVSFVNTNVTRNGEFRDANVSAVVFDLNTKENTYKLNGDFKYSFLNEKPDDKTGYNTSMYFGETSGKYRYSFGGNYVSKDYDSNDLGINFITHYHSLSGNANYRILNPNKTFNTFLLNLNAYSEFDNHTGRIQTGNVSLRMDSNSKTNDYFGFEITARPLEIYDFYEPRTLDQTRFVTSPQFIEKILSFSSNYNRKFALDLITVFALINEKDRINYGVTVRPIYRFNNHLSLTYTFKYFRQNNNTGFIDNFDDDNNSLTDDRIIFARRDRTTYTNTLQGKYAINNRMNINLSVRHYWSYAKNHDILDLQQDGSLADYIGYTANQNSNFNTWNFDLSYNYWIAPGSQISMLYRNNTAIFENEFGRTFSNVVNNDNLNHIFSISIRYFIDYNSLKR